MSANGTKTDQDVLVCHVDGLDSHRSGKYKDPSLSYVSNNRNIRKF